MCLIAELLYQSSPILQLLRGIIWGVFSISFYAGRGPLPFNVSVEGESCFLLSATI